MTSKNETKLVADMRKAGVAKYGDRLVVIKYHGSQYSQAGVSDLLVCLDGYFGACEVKDPRSHLVKGKPNEDKARNAATKKQLEFISDVEKAGGHAEVCVTVAEFMEFLETLTPFL